MSGTRWSTERLLDNAWKRFWSNTNKHSGIFGVNNDQETECWLWTGHKTSKGYGTFCFCGKRTYFVHRFIYEQTIGSIPCNLQVDHLCRHRNCVNPEHLELVTSQTNTLRGENHAAHYASRTHCEAGHVLSGANVYIRKDGVGGARRCRQCQKEYMQRYHAKCKK